jgi:hypothetical protein
MSTLTFDVATILEENHYGTIGEDIFASMHIPPTPDSMIHIRGMGSYAPRHPRVELKNPIVRIVVRNSKGKFQECEARIEEISDFLHNLRTVSVNDSRFVSILEAPPGIVEMPVDVTMRPMFYVEFECIRTSL